MSETLYSSSIDTNILWISDIHFKAHYVKTDEAKRKLEPFYGAFLEKIEEEQESRPIDYIFLTGDIAFAGTENDYKGFCEWFIVPLYNFFKKWLEEHQDVRWPRIIFIPGNHDISWDKNKQFMTFLQTFSKQNNTYIDRNVQLIKSNEALFAKSFANYTAMTKSLSVEIQKKFFNLNDLDVGGDYDKHRLFGYIVDHAKQLVIVLLNTSWYSIGDSINTLMVRGEFKKVTVGKAAKDDKYYYNKYKAEALNLLKRKDMIAEYGSQVIGRNLFPKEGLLKVFANYPHYVVITCMHHPLNWLNSKELYSYEGADQKEFILNTILDVSDAVLTSHEHLPISNRVEKINAHGWHFASGMFMEDKIDVLEGQVFFAHSRFSTLLIDSDKPNIAEKRYLYNREAVKWEPYETLHYDVLPKKKKLTPERKNKILSSLSSFSIAKLLNGKVPEGFRFPQPQTNTSEYCVYDLRYNDVRRLCIVALSPAFHARQNPALFPSNYFLDELIGTGSPPGTKIHFIWPDLLVDEALADKYLELSENHDEIFHLLLKKSDLLFNKFKINFFARFCDLQGVPLSGKDNEERFRAVKELSFINEPVPYWLL